MTTRGYALAFKCALTFVAAAAAITAAGPAAAEVVFRGTAQVESIKGCTGYHPGMDRRSSLHLAIPGNQSYNSVGFYTDVEARVYQTSNGLNLGKAVRTVATGVGPGAWTWSGPVWTIKGSSPSLSLITQSTKAIAMVFSITGPEKDHQGDGANCTIVWRAIYLRDDS
jgi:hypothetical protein